MERKARRQVRHLTARRRAKFLEVLEKTGNRRAAAEAIGLDPRLMDQRRQSDALLDRDWKAALAEASRGLAGREGPFDGVDGGGRRELNVIKRGRGGRMQIVASGKKRWSKTVEDRFLAALGMCGNVAAAARAVGFTESCVWQRRRAWPAFERAMEQVLEEAEIRIEYRLAMLGSDLEAAALEGGENSPENETPDGPMPEPPPSERGKFDPEFALRFLKWREEKRRGRVPKGGRERRRPRSIEDVRDSVVRKLKAIDRHDNARKLEEGWTKDEEGRMIPPGWARSP
jgi:hypothetical protein